MGVEEEEIRKSSSIDVSALIRANRYFLTRPIVIRFWIIDLLEKKEFKNGIDRYCYGTDGIASSFIMHHAVRLALSSVANKIIDYYSLEFF